MPKIADTKMNFLADLGKTLTKIGFCSLKDQIQYLRANLFVWRF